MESVVVYRIPGLVGEHGREWRHFVCWAAAAERPYLPASDETVLAYLREHPGTEKTQRGRVTALNAAHRRKKLPLPGEAEAVRRALNPARAQRLQHQRGRADAIIARLPVTGWPDALTGRRDAVILLLATSGLSYPQIAGLRQADVTLTADAVTIGAQPLLKLDATGTAGCPVRVFARWAAVLTHAPAATGHIHLERLLTAAADFAVDEPQPESSVPRPFPAAYARQPLLCDFDGRGMAYGYVDELDPLSAETVADIALTHLLAPPPPGEEDDLDTGWHERGIAARRRMKDVGDELDVLLARMEAIADSVSFPQDW
ncbi:hypothetical protein JK358_35555 [Nocardia sp. 2]|uniref:Tyr recombinase domain-containing protein n=1 Tax=Nocardia acididurans TaxID=2802282 RepID=A0ABS1MHI5_9NOCA|nr:hypothetical protein [Nocardia acididurans]MBL1079731.1 hypothetical protein [Nocardia acididurans]